MKAQTLFSGCIMGARVPAETICTLRKSIKTLGLVRNIPEDVCSSAKFEYILRETTHIIQRMGENPAPFLADINNCLGVEQGIVRINEYVTWLSVSV